MTVFLVKFSVFDFLCMFVYTDDYLFVFYRLESFCPTCDATLLNSVSVHYYYAKSAFLPRDATQSAVMPQYVVCPSVCLTVCNVEVPWSHILECFENNLAYCRLPQSLFSGWPRHWRSGGTGTPPKLGWNRVGVMSTKTCNISETVQDWTKITMRD